MKPAQLTKRIEELSEKLKPVPSEGIRIEFNSFTEPEQMVLRKNLELEDQYRGKWTKENIMQNSELIIKANMIIVQRLDELFLFAVPRALMLDEVDQFFFNVNFRGFWERWLECQKNVHKWSKKDREDFLRNELKKESMNGGKENLN